MRSVSITPLRIEARDDLAAVWFRGSWNHETDTEATPPVEVRGLLVLRREDDGAWRVVFERLG